MSQDRLTLREKRIGHLYADFTKAINADLEGLLRLTKDGDLNELSWRARNLVELQIWAEYCSVSEDNAYEFWEDAQRDFLELFRNAADSSEQIARYESELTPIKAPDRPKYSTAASKSLPKVRTDYFKEQNDFLSKFVHPTALSILMPIPPENQQNIRNMIVAAAEEYARDAKAVLSKSLIEKLHSRLLESL
jgi:hypothetical protein